jgi:apolipoprotein N-acyltransferase
LLRAVHELKSRRQAIFLGFLLSSMVAIGGFHWIVYVAQVFGDMPLPLAVLLLLGFCLIAAPQMIAFLVIAERFRFRVERLPFSLRPLFWSALYVALEYLAHFIKIFPENLGDTQVAFLDIAQVASLGGVPLLTFLPLFIGSSLFYLRVNFSRGYPMAIASVTLLLAADLWGAHDRKVVASAPSEVLRVGFIQHNMDDAEQQFAHTNEREVVDILVTKLLRKTRDLIQAEPRPDIVLWAETAYPMTFPTGMPARSGGGDFANGYANLVHEAVAGLGVPLLFGGYLSDPRYDYNAGILLGSDGRIAGRYLKQVLLIFGEYMPFDSWFPSLKTLNPMMGDFGRGPGPVPVPFSWHNRTLPLGVNICYEEILPEYMRGYVKNGARAFVNLTKDSWFGNTFEPWQHFQLSAPRAIEHHIPLIRITNTGLSGVVDTTGEVRLISEPFHEAYKTLAVKVPLDPKPTLYTVMGEWFAQLCAVFSAGLGVFMFRREE